LTGQRPHKGKLVEVLSQLGKTVPPAPRTLNSDIDPKLEMICLKAMELLPAARWPSMDHFKQALESWLAGAAPKRQVSETNPDESTVIELPVPINRPNRQMTRHRKRIIALMLASVVLFAASVFYISTKRGTVKIEVDDPNVEVHVDGRRIELKNLEEPLSLWIGKHQLEVRYGSMVVETRSFQLEHGLKKLIKVKFDPKATAHTSTSPPSNSSNFDLADSRPATVIAERGQQSSNIGTNTPATTNSVATSLRAAAADIKPAGTPNGAAVLRETAVDRVPTNDQERLASWIFQQGGSLSYRQGISQREISQLPDLPTTGATLIGIRLPQPKIWDDEDRQRLAMNTNWEHFELQQGFLTDVDYELLSKMPKVTSLMLSGGKITPARLGFIAQMKSLTSLRFHGVQVPSLAPLTPLRKLTVLWISANPGSTESTSEESLTIDALAQLQNVTDLNLSGQKFPLSEMNLITQLPRLTRLHLNGTAITDQELDQLAACPMLQSIYLDRTQVSDAGVARFIEASHSRLYGISITDSNITDAALLPLSKCQGLLDLNVAETSIGDAGLAAIADCKNMSSLWLTNTQVTDAGIASLAGLTRVMTLDLSHTNTTDESVPLLSRMKKLNYLGVRTTKITSSGYARLQDALPQCRIDW